MTAILLAVTGLDPKGWEERLRALAPHRDIRLWPQRVGDPADIAYVCAWQAPHGLFVGLPRLKAIFSLGAGVDHVLGDPRLPDVPVVRIVDPDLTMRMTEYVVLHVLMHHRRQRHYDAQQRERVWHEHAQPPASAVAVGVMGLGVLGRNSVEALRRIGFRVAGFSRTPKTLPGVETFHGEEGLDAFLRRSEILVCLLPATSLLWAHPKVTITPHNAAASDPDALVANMLRQIERYESGLPLEHVVDRRVGY